MPKEFTVIMEIRIFDGNMRSYSNLTHKFVFNIWEAMLKFSYVGL